jgi:hypothetical protein
MQIAKIPVSRGQVDSLYASGYLGRSIIDGTSLNLNFMCGDVYVLASCGGSACKSKTAKNHHSTVNAAHRASRVCISMQRDAIATIWCGSKKAFEKVMDAKEEEMTRIQAHD